LETVDIQQLSGRASALHTILHSKHASLMLGQYVRCVQAAFQYQQKLSDGQIVCGMTWFSCTWAVLLIYPSGYRITNTTITAVLHKWYSLVKEKRTTRMDFIRTVTKAFDVDSTKLSATEQDVDFIRFVIENFSAFEYKTQEEVLAVIRSVTNVLSVAGMQMMEVLSPSDLMRQLGVEGATAPIEVWSSNDMFV
jgi:cohesin loading factor subunit SCC2